MIKRMSCILPILMVYILLAGCSLDTSGSGGSGHRSFIDSPLDESVSEVFIPIAITTHANFRVTRILLSINMEPYDPDARETREEAVEEITPGLYQTNFIWTPVIPGRYKIMAYSYTDGRINDWDSWTTHTINLIINERATGGGAGMPTPRPSPLPPTPAAPSQPPQVNFWADSLSLTAGACTYLRWESAFVEQLTLDGEAVAFTGSRQVCPASTMSYSLRGRSAGGEEEKTVTLTVVPPVTVEPPTAVPPDTTPPSLTGLSQSAAVIFDNPSCGPVNNTISIKIQDPGGIAKVELHYRARSSKVTGSWRSVGMSSSGGNKYSATLGSSELSASLAAYVPGNVDIIVKAWNKSNNLSQSAQMTFKAEYCLF